MSGAYSRAAAMVLALGIIVGCGHEVLPSAGPREPTSPQQVKIYPKYPAKYELLGRVELPITSELMWDRRGNANATFEHLKEKAAALGGNGLLLVVDPANYDYIAVSGYHKEFFQVPMRGDPPTAVAEAIFVIKE
jgi:hypothetical protein